MREKAGGKWQTKGREGGWNSKVVGGWLIKKFVSDVKG